MTLDDLLALLPDNTSGAIDAADLRTVVTELWNKAAAADALPAVYAGGLTADGTLVDGPDGWTARSDSAGLYTVTHGLGTLAYAVVVTPLAKTVDGWSAAVEATSETGFTFGTYSDQHGGLHGVYSNFVVVRP